MPLSVVYQITLKRLSYLYPEFRLYKLSGTYMYVVWFPELLSLVIKGNYDS